MGVGAYAQDSTVGVGENFPAISEVSFPLHVQAYGFVVDKLYEVLWEIRSVIAYM